MKLAREIGGAKAAKELGVPEGTIHTWLKAARSGGMDIGEGSHTPESAMSLAEELAMLSKKVKDQDLADAMREINAEDTCNDTYGRIRMYQALQLKQPEGVHIPSERTVYRVMEEIGLSHRPKRKPNGITKADKEARKSYDLVKRDFTADQPLTKCVTDITEIKAKDDKLYVSGIFDCFDSAVLGLAMETNMKATLCQHTVENAYMAYPEIRGAILHSDRGTQYTSELYRTT